MYSCQKVKHLKMRNKNWLQKTQASTKFKYPGILLLEDKNVTPKFKGCLVLMKNAFRQKQTKQCGELLDNVAKFH